ncbi:MAG: flagellin [Deltaproteobacteria bacterium RBG_13_43_22]|nr:MAG: flagellin [Deltaproteobacteria bacterium RBG_13_43_22]
MANDISLTQGMRANLISLQLTTKLLGATQARLSTGKRVNTAMDDPVNYFAAQSHMTRASDLAARKDGMGEAINIVTAADKGITAITTLIEQAKGIATSALATTDVASRASYATQFDTVMSQILTMAKDAGYKGTNLLDNGAVDVKFNEDGSSKLTVSGFGGTTLGQISLAFTTTWGVGDAFINTSLSLIGTASEILRTKAKTLAANMNVITTRQDFTKNMIDTLKTGADDLTLADMNEESANMLMLQTRQSLGTTSLSIASQAAQAVLKLFG